MNDQRVEFQNGNKIQKANTSVCKQINQRDITLSAGKHEQGITKGLEGQSLQWLSTSHKQNLDHTKGTCDRPGTAQDAAQHKLKLYLQL